MVKIKNDSQGLCLLLAFEQKKIPQTARESTILRTVSKDFSKSKKSYEREGGRGIYFCVFFLN